MASGKLTPRQKMINMMYLVLTALLALNVSREVMDAFYDVMKNQETTIATVERQNASVYAAFDAAYAENPTKTKEWRDKAYNVQGRAEELETYLESLKDTLVSLSGGIDEETGKPKRMDNKEKVANYMIVQKHGVELKEKLNEYRDFLIGYAGNNEELKEALTQVFNTEDIKNEDGVAEPWEKNRFEHYPLIAVTTFLTNMQADVKNAEAQTIDYLQENIGRRDLKFTGVKALVMPKSNYVTQGDYYEADVFLAAYDETQDPTIIIEGQELSAEEIVNGVGKYKIKTSATGEQKWAGVIKLTQGGRPFEYPVKATYTVAPPSVVISPSKLNVLYRYVDNPLEISVPGVNPKNLRVSGKGIRKTGNGWLADVTKVSGKKMDITVQVLDEEGNVKQTQSKEFRIKGLPPALGLIYGKPGGKFSQNAIKNLTVSAEYQDFPYELPLSVIQFEVKIEGFPSTVIKGTKMDNNNRARIEGLRPGTSVFITNIVARTPKGDRITNIASIPLEVN
jgi:gliding motility-associated protein GldM